MRSEIIARLLMGVALWVVPCAIRSQAALPLYDGFETYPRGVSLNGSNGWVAADAGFVARGGAVWSGSNAAALPPAATVSNALPGATNMWVDLYITNAAPAVVGDFTAEDVDTNLAAMCYVATNGFPVVWHPASNAWLVCSNDYWGTATTNFNTNTWLRISVCENYSDRKAAFFLNDHLLLPPVRFINTNLAGSAMFGLSGGCNATSYFDEVFALYTPTNLVADLDHDGMAEGDEIQLYGSVEVRHRPVITVTQPAHGWIAPSNSFAVMPGSSTSFTFHADAAYVVAQVYTNGQPVGTFTEQGTRNASWQWNNIISNGLSDGTVSALVSYVATLYVPRDYATIQEAITAAAAGETVVVSNGTYAGNVALGSGVALVGTNVVVSGNLTVAAGVTGTVWNSSGFVVSNGTTIVTGLLVISNGTANLGSVTFVGGGAISLVNVTSVTINGAILGGTRTIDASWSALTAQTPPFHDDFERYLVGAKLLSQGAYGWSADADGVVVESNLVYRGTNAAVLPANSVLSNTLASAGSSNVWVTLNLRDAARLDETVVELESRWTNNAAILFLNTSGYVTVYDAGALGFTVLSNDIAGRRVDTVAPSDWPRIALNVNYRNREVAVFLDGRLLRQQMPFVNASQANCARLTCEAGSSGSSYLDDVGVWTNAPAELLSGVHADLDRDGIADAWEIQNAGNTMLWPRGSVFKIR